MIRVVQKPKALWEITARIRQKAIMADVDQGETLWHENLSGKISKILISIVGEANLDDSQLDESVDNISVDAVRYEKYLLQCDININDKSWFQPDKFNNESE